MDLRAGDNPLLSSLLVTLVSDALADQIVVRRTVHVRPADRAHDGSTNARNWLGNEQAFNTVIQPAGTNCTRQQLYEKYIQTADVCARRISKTMQHKDVSLDCSCTGIEADELASLTGFVRFTWWSTAVSV